MNVQELRSHDQEALGTQLVRSRAKLDGLVEDLRRVDSELADLSGEQQRYRLLHEVCTALDELDELGAAQLFWGEQLSESGGRDRVLLARGRVDAFEKRLGEIEGRRQAIIDEIELEQDTTEILEDEVYEAQREQELRKQEWVIERELAELPVRASVMPWARGGEDDQRFRKSLAASLLLSLLFGLLLPYIPLPVLDPWEASQVPERFTSLIRDEPPPPPPVVEQTRPEEELAPEESLLAEETAPEPIPAQAPKETAKSKGILAFREKFSSLADSKPAARLGAQARIRKPGEAAVGRPQRSLVMSHQPGSSGGIDIAALSRDVGGGGDGGIEGVEVTQATSAIGAITGPERRLSEGPGLSRTDEEIQIVFDRHKAALYRLYNRELRKNPTLRGQLVLRMRIEPDGSVTLCEVHSTDMKAPQLSAQVVARVRTFDFGAKEDIPAITILYPIDFLPAT